jgi:capsular polysaccharide biosynthesis protein
MEIQRLASAAPVAKRQATESAVASAARPSQPTELRKLTVAPALASIKPQATPQATQQPPPTSTHASGQPDVEQKASVAHQSAADQPAQAGARVTAGDPSPDNAEQTRQGTSIDLNEPAMHLLSSEAADAATPST